MANIETAGYWVEPRPPAPPEPVTPPPLVRDDLAGWVWAIPFVAALLMVALISPLTKNPGAGFAMFVVFLLPASAATLGVLRQRRAEKIRRLEAANLAAREAAAEKEATNLAGNAAVLLQRSKVNSQKLLSYLDNASGWLARAQGEYDQKAYGPFWDAVEQGALNLAGFRDIAQQLSHDSGSYYQMLSGRIHTFPVLGITSSTLPDPSAALTELQRVLRAGQTNFEFATIWEHRKTREVLIEGFRNLGEAVSNLQFGIQGAVDELRGAVSSDMAKLLEEQVRTRDTSALQAGEHLDMLDQIHKRLENP
jgi:hypothetical protein